MMQKATRSTASSRGSQKTFIEPNRTQQQLKKIKEAEQIEDNLRLKAPTIYEIIAKEGEEELRRPAFSLWWSGLAAGLAISLSVFAEGILHIEMAGMGAQTVIENFGYCIGFLVVIVGRMQLFTENTITAVLPALTNPTRRSLFKTLRLWGIVFGANMVGTFLAATMTIHGNIFTPEQVASFNHISLHMVEKSIGEAFFHGIPAGFIIAALVWMLPSAKGFEFPVIIIMTYLIAIGGFTHVIAGSTEVFLLILQGMMPPLEGISFILSTGAGNIMGGTFLFALLAYAQIREEI